MSTPSASSAQDRVRQYRELAKVYRQDPAFRARAAADPHAVLAEQGVDVPPWIEVRIVEDTAETFHFVLPADPNAGLKDEDLAMIAGGKQKSGGSGTAGSYATRHPG